MAGVTQRTVYRLRRESRREARPAAAQVLRRPPARRHAEPGHQRHRQHRPDAPAEPDPAHHVAPDGRRRADHDAHDQPAAGASSRCSAVPVSLVVTILIASRSQKQFAAQWASTGTLNGHVEEMHTGHAIVKVFGRQEEAIDTFDEENERLYEASYRAQFISGIIQPAMNFIANLNYVAIAVIGGLRSRPGRCPWATSSRSSSTRASSPSRSSRPPASPTSSSRRSPPPSASSSCSTSRRRSPTRSQPRRAGQGRRRASRFEDVSFRYVPDTPLIDDLSLDVQSRATRSPSSARPAPARRRSSTC